MTTIKYAGYDLSSLIDVKKITRTVGNERKITVDSTPTIGGNVQRVSTEGKIIEVRFSLASFKLSDIQFVDVNQPSNIQFGNINKIREQVAGIFNQNEAKRLEISDESDRYYLALVDGVPKLEDIQTWYDETTVTFYVPDGVAHSITYKQVLNYTEEGNKLIFDIENNGNTDAYPIIRIENIEELGYAGVVNQNGVIEIGNINEQGTEDFKRTEYLIEYKSSGTGFEVNKGIFNDDAWALTGNIGTRLRDGRTFTKMSGINSTSGQNGASMTFTIPPDSNGETGSLYDYIRWRQAFECTFSEQGIFKIVVTDINDQFMYGIQAVKYANGHQAYYDILGRNDEGTSTVYKRFKNIKTTNKALDNPLALIRGNSDIRRVDDKITAYWDTKYYDIHMPEIKGMVSAKIHFLFGNFGTKKYPEVNYLDWFRYGKNFVVKERDIPNRYPAGSVIEINNEDNTLQVDGKYQLNDVVQGSTFITLPTGTSKLEVHLSEWVVKKPKVTIEFEERWL